MRVHVVAQHGAISQPAQPRIQMNSRKAAPADWHIVQMCVSMSIRVYAGAHVLPSRLVLIQSD